MNKRISKLNPKKGFYLNIISLKNSVQYERVTLLDHFAYIHTIDSVHETHAQRGVPSVQSVPTPIEDPSGDVRPLV